MPEVTSIQTRLTQSNSYGHIIKAKPRLCLAQAHPSPTPPSSPHRLPSPSICTTNPLGCAQYSGSDQASKEPGLGCHAHASRKHACSAPQIPIGWRGHDAGPLGMSTLAGRPFLRRPQPSAAGVNMAPPSSRNSGHAHPLRPVHLFAIYRIVTSIRHAPSPHPQRNPHRPFFLTPTHTTSITSPSTLPPTHSPPPASSRLNSSLAATNNPSS